MPFKRCTLGRADTGLRYTGPWIPPGHDTPGHVRYSGPCQILRAMSDTPGHVRYSRPHHTTQASSYYPGLINHTRPHQSYPASFNQSGLVLSIRPRSINPGMFYQSGYYSSWLARHVSPGGQTPLFQGYNLRYNPTRRRPLLGISVKLQEDHILETSSYGIQTSHNNRYRVAEGSRRLADLY